MAEERVEEHEHTVTENDEGTSESRSDRVVEKDKGSSSGGRDETVVEETVVEEHD
jgi:hypothetical protein